MLFFWRKQCLFQLGSLAALFPQLSKMEVPVHMIHERDRPEVVQRWLLPNEPVVLNKNLFED